MNVVPTHASSCEAAPFGDGQSAMGRFDKRWSGLDFETIGSTFPTCSDRMHSVLETPNEISPECCQWFGVYSLFLVRTSEKILRKRASPQLKGLRPVLGIGIESQSG